MKTKKPVYRRYFSSSGASVRRASKRENVEMQMFCISYVNCF